MQSVTRNRPMSPGQEPAEPDPQSCIISPLSVRIPVAVKMTGIGRSKLYKLIQEGAIVRKDQPLARKLPHSTDGMSLCKMDAARSGAARGSQAG